MTGTAVILPEPAHVVPASAAQTQAVSAGPPSAVAVARPTYGVMPKNTADGFQGSSRNRNIIRHLMRPLMKWLEHPEVEEIQINRPGEVIQRLRKQVNGSIYAVHEDDELSRSYLTMLAYVVANNANMDGFGPEGKPVVYGTLPGGHRFVCGIGPNIQFQDTEIDEDGSIAMVVRQFTAQNTIELKHYGVEQGRALTQHRFAHVGKSADDDSDPYSMLFNSIQRGDHILISGETGTGKTTLMRFLIDRLDRNFRILTVEDTREVVVPHINHCHVVLDRSGGSNNFSYKDVVDLVVRMTPDVVMAGEVSTKNAAAIWELMRSGHGHFMTTIHAKSCLEALDTFMTRIGHVSPEEVRDRPRILEQMRDMMRVVQIERFGDQRRITEIL